MAKIRAQGADIQLLAKIEATYGTPPSSNWKPLLASKFDGGGNKPLNYDPELGLGPDAQDPFYDGVDVDFSIEVHMGIRSVGFWLRALLGAPTTTGSGPYTHVFTSGIELPSLSFEEGHLALTTPIYFVRSGCKFGGAVIELARKGPGKLAMTGMAQNVSRATSSAGGTPLAAFAPGKFFNRALLIRKDGATLAQLTGGRINFSNGLERVETIGRGDGLIEGADETDRTADGTLDLRLTSDSALYDMAMTNENSMDLLFRWKTPESASYKLDLDFGRVFVDWKQPPVNGPGAVTSSLAWRAAKTSSSVAMLTATLVTDVATY